MTEAVCAVPGLCNSCLKKGGARKSEAADYGAKRRLRTGDMTCVRQAAMERGASANSTKSNSSHFKRISAETLSVQETGQPLTIPLDPQSNLPLQIFLLPTTITILSLTHYLMI